MIKMRNVLAAGTMVASALIAPVTMPAGFASADSVAQTTSVTSTLTSMEKPCRKHRNPDRCRARHGRHHGHRHERFRHRGDGGGGRATGSGSGSISGLSGGDSPGSGGSGRGVND